MAQLVLTVVGNYFLAGGGGALAGALIGGAIDRSLLPDQKFEGPKIDDLRVIGLEYGDPIAYIKGAPVLAGQLWWSSDRRAIANTVTQESKGGGPSISQTTYTYEVDFRVGFTCNQVIGLSRLWVNGKLVYNVRPDASVAALAASVSGTYASRLTIYNGATSQLPDPTEEAAVGVGNSPAYLGAASIFIERFQLGPSGNMPNVTGEWFTKGTGGGGGGYADKFNEELDVHYSAITGSLNAFERARGIFTDYGDMVSCPSRVSVGVPDDIRRTVPQTTAIGIRFKFVLGDPLSDDDGGVIYFNNAAGSVNRFLFNPRREIGFDALQRPQLILSGSTFTLGAAALDGEQFYQFDLTIAPGVSNGSVVTISRLPDEAVVITQTLTGTFNGLDIGTQGFYMDSTSPGAPTTLTSYADLFVLPARAVIEDETLRDVVDALLLRSGLQTSEFDTSALDSITTPVHALAISQVTTTRQVIDLLRSCYFFDAVLSDKLYFRPRGGAAVATIPFADLGASDNSEGDPEPLTIQPGSELELPGTWALTYMNIDADCTKDTQQSDRLGSASRTTQGQEVPLGFTAAEAKAIADTWRDDALVAAMGTTQIKLLLHHAAKEPTDVLSVVARDGSTYRMRMVNLSESAMVRTFDAVFDDANVLTQAGITSDDYVPSSEVSVPGNTALRILDIALLRDADNGVGLYAAARGETASYPGAVVFKSTDDSDWQQQGSITESAVLGSASTVLANWTGGNLVDESNVVTVNVGPGTLSSITHAAMVDGGGNLCLIGDEVLNFKTASLVTPGVYILSGFLRGRKGTEWAMGTHVASDRFVLLQTTGMRRITMETLEIGATRYWRGVTIGRDINSAGSQAVEFNGVSLKPWSPVDALSSRVVSDTDSLLLHMNGTNGSTTFTDSSLNALPMTAVGNAQISTAQSQFGGASALFDGTGDAVKTPHHTQLDVPTGDFTIEFWIRYASIAASQVHFVKATGTGFYSYQLFYNQPTGKLIFSGYDSVNVLAYSISSTTSPVINTWYHVAAVRQGSTFRLYINGVQEGTATSAATLRSNSGDATAVGAFDTGTTSTNGYIDDLRFRKGLCLYPSGTTFTPPTSQLPDPSASTTDVGISWSRRTRLAKNFGTGSVPLGEETEAYEVDIFSDGTYTTLKRTLAVSAPAATYTTAQQVIDFGAAQATVYARIYQLSATVGRGYVLQGVF